MQVASILAIVGALIGAVAVMMIGRSLRGRDFMGLAVTLWIVFGIGGALFLPSITAGANLDLLVEGTDPNTLLLANAIMIPALSCLATMFVGIFFIAASSPSAAND